MRRSPTFPLAAVLFLGFLGTAAFTLPAQAPQKPAAQPAPAPRTFDVASIRPSPPLDPAAIQAAMNAGKTPAFGLQIHGLRAEYDYMSLKALIGDAYDVRPYQISGPDWLDSERFNIEATMPEGSTKDDAPAMLKALLEDRFKLFAHIAEEEQPVLALVAGKGGPKLKPAATTPEPLDLDAPLKPGQLKIDMGDGPAIVTRGTDGSATTNMGLRGTFSQRIDTQTQTVHIQADDLTMDGFADLLTRVLQVGGPGQQVVNQTGISGYYEVSLDLSIADLMARARAQGANVPGPVGSGAIGEASDPSGTGNSVVASVQKAGLKLESRKVSVKRLVIDHIEKTPTEN